MTEKQQTAVQWLYQEWQEAGELIWEDFLNKALPMERKQIEEAYNQGIEATFQFHYGDGKQYFTDTYQTEP